MTITGIATSPVAPTSRALTPARCGSYHASITGRTRILDREIRALLLAPFERRHWRALTGLLTTVRPGGRALVRYLSQRGHYPWSVSVRTPLGEAPVTLYSRHDLLTLNEVFCRRDYGEEAPATVVDVGANIGLATLYWLTRRADARVIAYEPEPRNVARLRETVRAFADRVEIVEAAVAATAGVADFVSEPSGRYGRLADGKLHGPMFKVRVLSLSDELRRIQEANGSPVDLVKLDTEGSEALILKSLGQDHPEVIWEDEVGRVHRTAPRLAGAHAGPLAS